MENLCVKESEETIYHIFHSCQFARIVWVVFELPAIVYDSPMTDVWDWVYYLKHVISSDQFSQFVCCSWMLWKNCNGVAVSVG